MNIAYQVIGEGPIDLVFVSGWVSHLEYMWEEPSVARFFNRLAAFARVILFDKRGTGLSDQTTDLPTLEQRMDDVRAVMEAAQSERAAVFGMSEGGNMCLLFAATYPERTIALITFGGLSRTSELTAMKATGISLYRVVTPILVITALIAASLFLFDEIYLPGANRRQEALRAEIKNKPAQTFLRPGREWISGQSDQTGPLAGQAQSLTVPRFWALMLVMAVGYAAVVWAGSLSPTAAATTSALPPAGRVSSNALHDSGREVGGHAWRDGREWNEGRGVAHSRLRQRFTSGEHRVANSTE